MTIVARIGRSACYFGAAMLILLIAGEGTVGAQDLDFRIPKFEFFNDGKTFKPGVTPYAEIDDFRKSLYPNLKARLFRKDEVDAKPVSVVANGPDGPDRCFIFNAMLITIRPTTTEIYLDGVPRVAGDWIVVFEIGEWTKGPIKLSSKAVDEYFRRGFRFSTESPKQISVAAPFNLLGLIAPQRAARREEEKERKKEEAAERLRAAQQTAVAQLADDRLCVWFRPARREFLLAEKRDCGGCVQKETRNAELAAQWFGRFATLWAR